MNNEEFNAIERAEKKLYSPTAKDLDRKRSSLSEEKRMEKDSWGGENINISQMSQKPKADYSYLTLFFIFSFIFFLGSIIFALYLYSLVTNVVSPENVSITSSGPVSVKGGEEIYLQVVVTNNNNISLEYTDLILTFPNGSKIYSNKVNDTQYRKSLGTIKPNEAVTETIRFSLFGEESAEKDIKIAIEYRNENSNAIIKKDSIYKTIINSSPLSLYFDVPKDANSNQEITIGAKVITNSKETLKDVLLNISYPAGFIFKSATPSPTSGDSIWELGDMKQGAEKSIKIKGIIQGQNEEDKTFRASAGIRTNRDSNKVDVAYASALKTVSIKKPFIDVNLALNGKTDEIYVMADGQTVRGDIEWANNLPVSLLHSEVTIEITGDVLDKSTVNTSGGFYKSAENTILWDKTGRGITDSIASGQNGRLSFSFSAIPLLSSRGSIFKNPEIYIKLKFKGIRSSEGGEESSLVETTLSRTVKLLSNLQMASRALYYSGPFKNTGPLPPIHDNETTYTVIWSVINSSNDVSSATVRATLPPYARWIGVTSPESEDISYNPLGGEILWRVGGVKAGSGVSIPAKEVAFQIGITPSLSQAGLSSVPLVSESTISGMDDFAKESITYVRKAPTSSMTGDPLVKTEETGSIK